MYYNYFLLTSNDGSQNKQPVGFSQHGTADPTVICWWRSCDLHVQTILTSNWLNFAERTLIKPPRPTRYLSLSLTHTYEGCLMQQKLIQMHDLPQCEICCHRDKARYWWVWKAQSQYWLSSLCLLQSRWYHSRLPDHLGALQNINKVYKSDSNTAKKKIPQTETHSCGWSCFFPTAFLDVCQVTGRKTHQDKPMVWAVLNSEQLHH